MSLKYNIISFSVVVLSHIVIASQVEGDSGSPAPSLAPSHPDYQNVGHTDASKASREPPPPRSTPADDKGSGNEDGVGPSPPDPNRSHADDGKHAKAIADNGANHNTSTTSHTESNFSEAFNLKHLIYFENSSNNNG